MKRVYIFDEYSSSLQNGIGTYIGNLLVCLRNKDVERNVLLLNSFERKLSIKERGGVRYFYIPPFARGDFSSDSPLLVSFLNLHIADSEENVFFLNHFPCEYLLQTLKLIFSLSKIVFVIHDQSWTLPLWGDSKGLRRPIDAIKRKYGSRTNYV